MFFVQMWYTGCQEVVPHKRQTQVRKRNLVDTYLYPTSGAAVGIVLGFPNETPRAAPEESKTGRGIVLVFPHETPRTGLTALTGRGISNYGATARVSQ